MNSIEPLLLSLPLTHQMVFAALTCEQMLASIRRFDAGETQPGTPIFRAAIEALCSYGVHAPADQRALISHLQQQLEAFWPDLDESTNPAASYAFDACVPLGEALALAQDGAVEHVLQCATAARDTVDMYVQGVSDVDLPPAELNAFIDATPVMQREVARQEALARALAVEPHLTPNVIDRLRTQSGQGPLVDFAELDSPV